MKLSLFLIRFHYFPDFEAEGRVENIDWIFFRKTRPDPLRTNMASNKRLPGDERPEDYPNVTDTRTYSDFILYFERTGRFQSNSILDTDRRMGVITLLKANRITKLSLDRRLSPVQVTLTPGQPPNKVFLFAIVRRGNTCWRLSRVALLLYNFVSPFSCQQGGTGRHHCQNECLHGRHDQGREGDGGH